MLRQSSGTLLCSLAVDIVCDIWQPCSCDTTCEICTVSDVLLIMVLILDSNSEHVAHARMKIGLFGEEKNPIRILGCSRSNRMP